MSSVCVWLKFFHSRKCGASRERGAAPPRATPRRRPLVSRLANGSRPAAVVGNARRVRRFRGAPRGTHNQWQRQRDRSGPGSFNSGPGACKTHRGWACSCDARRAARAHAAHRRREGDITRRAAHWQRELRECFAAAARERGRDLHGERHGRAGGNGTVLRWGCHDGERGSTRSASPCRRQRRHRPLPHLAVLPHCKIALHAVPSRIALRQLRTMAPTAMTEIVARASAHGDTICSVAYSPDGTKIVSASSDKTIKVWDSGAFWPSNRPSLTKTDA